MVALEDTSLTPSQDDAVNAVERFLDTDDACFLLRGSAGTGKTTLVAHLIRRLLKQKRSFVLLAPTGRAARILGSKTGQNASTVHAWIYAFDNIRIFEQAESKNDPGMRFQFRLKSDDPGKTLFIVDEASMVADVESEQDILRFGSGRLLADLIEFTRVARSGRTEISSKLLFVGDPAQLPPVGQTLSPALSADYLREKFGLTSASSELTEVMRHQAGGAILDRATKLRDQILSGKFNTFSLSASGAEIAPASIEDGVSLMTDAVRSSGVLITYSNAQALKFNQAVRNRLWGDDKAAVRIGDRLLVNRNCIQHQLFNGDIVAVADIAAAAESRTVWMKGVAEPKELRFRRAAVAHTTANGQSRRTECLLLENLLDSRERALTPLEQRALFVDFRQRHPKLAPKSAEFSMTLLSDPFFNALQVKYGYALTCHKAQGGEWETAIVQFGNGLGTGEHFFRWAYTAITRAKTRLLTIDAPRFDSYSEMQWPEPVPSAVSARATNSPLDADWNRFSFVSGDEILFAHHCRLRDAWSADGITIDQLERLQHCERYSLMRHDERAAVQYWYRMNHQPSRVAKVPDRDSNPTLLDLALTAMRSVLLGEEPASRPFGENEFVRAFRTRIEQKLSGTDIRLVSGRPIQYGLRLAFEHAGSTAEIDFYHDKKQRWTRITEVGGLGASKGLIDRLRGLI